MLPLDLHVLSLPLAFILSQDQTLHCKRFDLTIIISLEIKTSDIICLLRLYLTNKYCYLLVLLLSIFSKILILLSKNSDANGFEPFFSLYYWYILILKELFYLPFFWLGCKSKSRIISLKIYFQNFKIIFFDNLTCYEKKLIDFFEADCKDTMG